MKKILFLAPHSFPIYSSESIVNAKIAYALAENGNQVEVFALEPKGIYPSLPDIEKRLLNSPDLCIRTFKQPIFRRKKNGFLVKAILAFKQLLLFFKTGLFYNGIDISYYFSKKVEEVVHSDIRSYDIMITRGYCTEIAGGNISRKYGIKWIMNWNDPYPMEKFPPPYGYGYKFKLPFYKERVLTLIQRYADFYTFPSDRLRNYMLKYLKDVPYEKTEVIPHIAHSIFLPENKKKNDKKIKIIHAGNVTTPRSPDNFLEALSIMLKENRIYEDQIECVFIGHVPNNFNEKIKDLELSQIVKVMPPMNYFNTLKNLSNGNIALIIEAICEEGIYLPTKVVDSFQCKLPIFCVSPSNGTLKDLVYQYNIGYFADNQNVFDIKETLKVLMIDNNSNKLPIIDKTQLSYFFEKEICNQYNMVFENIL